MYRATAAAVVESDGSVRTTSTCTCGWLLETSAPTEELASQVADRACRNHLLDHEAEAPGAPAEPAAATVSSSAGLGRSAPVARPRDAPGHRITHGPSVKIGAEWARTTSCQCGWETRTRARTPDLAARGGRIAHEEHVDLELSRTPARDLVVLLGLVVVVGVLLLAACSVVLHVSAR